MMELTLEEIVGLMFKPQIFIPVIYPGILTALIVIILLLWVERKVAGKVQVRYGPLYVFKPLGGILQLIADLIRFLFAEVIIPKRADKLAFIMGPILLFTFVYIPTTLLPVSETFTAINSDISLLAVLALLTIGPIFILIIGWASDNKFSLIGGLREGYMVMAYEISLFITVLSMAVIYNSLNIIDIVKAQKNGLWGIVLNPLAAIVFLIIAFMSTSRFPYEIAEAESEIVMGAYTEYSGILYGLTMGASYVKFYVLSLLFTYLFLGGWYPLPENLMGNPIFPALVVLAKASIVMIFGVFLRAVYPRYRIDHALKIGWHKIFTASIISLIISIVVVGVSIGTLG